MPYGQGSVYEITTTTLRRLTVYQQTSYALLATKE